MGANPPPSEPPVEPAPAPTEPSEARPRFSVGRILLLAVTGVSLYLLAPSIGEVFSAWDRLGEFNPLALPIVLALEGASFACVWVLTAIALRKDHWDAIVLSQLAGNAFNRVTPGGGATGTALQARMLTDAGYEYTKALTALTVQSLLITAALVAMPVLVIPGVLTGAALPGSLLQAAWLGAVVFVVMAAVGTLLLATRRPVKRLGDFLAGFANLFRFRRPKIEGLGDRLLVERDEIRDTMGSRWHEAVGAAVGRWFFEYLVLLLALYAIDARPDPWSVLLAFVAASVLSMIPITPGGLGFVEAGLTATLVAAGIGAEKALAATLLFRLVSFWLPLPIGAVAGWWFRRRYPRVPRV
ncbi:MAG: flippase-like domain-containing protein [Actinobacteria bacterium]|nr:flippase-like domain-containing protein [Actinomycetota bacterium]